MLQLSKAIASRIRNLCANRHASKARLVRATLSDIPFLMEVYASAQDDGAVVPAQGSTRPILERAVKSSCRVLPAQDAAHPFIVGAPVTGSVDDLFLVWYEDAKAGVLWLRDYDDAHLAPTTYGEILLIWLQPDCRGKAIWPMVDAFAKQWATRARKSTLVGRCRKPSRRMAELFTRSEYTPIGPKPNGATAHMWSTHRSAVIGRR